MRSRFRLSFLLCQLCFVLLMSAGCRPAPVPTANGKPRIVTTTGMVADLVRRVAGDHADVVGLFGAVDPHLYAPTASDVVQIMEADLVFYSGLHLEGPMDDAFKGRERRGGKIYAVTSQLTPEQVRTPEGSAGHPDPHVWHDPVLWGECALFVAEVLAEQDPAHADEYRSNAEVFQQELIEIDEFARGVFAAIPEKQRHLVTAHDAFEYFAARYGLKVRSIQGISTQSEAGLHDQLQLIDFMVEQQIPCIFIESTVPPKNVGQVIKGAEVKGWKIQQGNVLFSDAMGAPGTYEGTYTGMLDHNIKAIATGLGSQWEGSFSFRDYHETSP